MKLYYYTIGFTDEWVSYPIRKYHEDDWNFTGKIQYTFKERDKEPEIEFEIQSIDNSWYVKLFPFFAPDARWVDSDILWYETEPYEPFIPKKVIVECN